MRRLGAGPSSTVYSTATIDQKVVQSERRPLYLPSLMLPMFHCLVIMTAVLLQVFVSVANRSIGKIQSKRAHYVAFCQSVEVHSGKAKGASSCTHVTSCCARRGTLASPRHFSTNRPSMDAFPPLEEYYSPLQSLELPTSLDLNQLVPVPPLEQPDGGADWSPPELPVPSTSHAPAEATPSFVATPDAPQAGSEAGPKRKPKQAACKVLD